MKTLFSYILITCAIVAALGAGAGLAALMPAPARTVLPAEEPIAHETQSQTLIAAAPFNKADLVQKAFEAAALCDLAHDWATQGALAMRASGRKEDGIPFLLKCRPAVERVCTIADELESALKFIDNEDLQLKATKVISNSRAMLYQLKKCYADVGLQY